MSFTYLILLIISASFPLIRSFGAPLYFSRQWKFLFPAIAATAVPFLIWDNVFTSAGVWGFNSSYITGYFIFKLPVEEVLFFILIPYCCIFIHEVVKFKLPVSGKQAHWINASILVFLILMLSLHIDLKYTASASAFAMVVLLLNWIFQGEVLRQFYLSFLFMLLPFFVINGLLTGSFIHEEVVWYNDGENLGIRLLTIPVEDFIYCFGLMLPVTGIYEYLIRKYSQTPRA